MGEALQFLRERGEGGGLAVIFDVPVVDYGRFDSDFMVDNENCEANEYDIEKWKAGEKKLYACRLHVWLKVQTERDLTPTECEIA